MSQERSPKMRRNVVGDGLLSTSVRGDGMSKAVLAAAAERLGLAEGGRWRALTGGAAFRKATAL